MPTLRILGTVPACRYDQRPELGDHADHSLRLVTATLTPPRVDTASGADEIPPTDIDCTAVVRVGDNGTSLHADKPSSAAETKGTRSRAALGVRHGIVPLLSQRPIGGLWSTRNERARSGASSLPIGRPVPRPGSRYYGVAGFALLCPTFTRILAVPPYCSQCSAHGEQRNGGPGIRTRPG